MLAVPPPCVTRRLVAEPLLDRMDLKALARDLGRGLMAGNRAAWATVVVSVFLGEPQEQPTSPGGRGSFISELYTSSAVCATLYPPAFFSPTLKNTHAPPCLVSSFSSATPSGRAGEPLRCRLRTAQGGPLRRRCAPWLNVCL